MKMKPEEKLKYVKDQIAEQVQISPSGRVHLRLYTLTDGEDEFATTLITTTEQCTILEKMQKEGYIKDLDFDEKGYGAKFEVVPPHKAPIRLRTIEHIARMLGDQFTGSEIVDILVDYGIPRYEIPYPNTKWRTLQETFLMLGTSPNAAQRAKFNGAITTFLHPLNFNADESRSHQLISDFNTYLKYDGYEIVVADDGEGYTLVSTADKTKLSKPEAARTEQEVREEKNARATPKPSPPPIFDFVEQPPEEDFSERVEYETGIVRNPKAAENLAVVREAYKTLMAIVSSFCEDPKEPSRELNIAYTELAKLVRGHLNDFCGDFSEFEVFSFDQYKGSDFGIPFESLYSAEYEFKVKKRPMHWDEVRPTMNAVLGRIEDVCDAAKSPNVISEPTIQKVIGDAMLLLSKIAAKRKGEKPAADKTIKMEITKMPPLHVKGDPKPSGSYITKKNDDFYYKGRCLNLSKNADYSKTFAALYALAPEGGEVPYAKLLAEVRSRIPKLKHEERSDEDVRKFVQRNLTDKGNGFLRYAGIPETEDNGKPLIEVIRGTGIVFNNSAG